MLHSLLIPGSLTYISVASNRRLKAPAFKVLGAYLAKVRLRFYVSYQLMILCQLGHKPTIP